MTRKNRYIVARDAFREAYNVQSIYGIVCARWLSKKEADKRCAKLNAEWRRAEYVEALKKAREAERVLRVAIRCIQQYKRKTKKG